MVETPKDNPFDRYIDWRIKKNKNAIIIWNGPTGSGKTYAAIRKAYDLSQRFGTNFSIKDNVDFRFSDMMQKMLLPQNSKPGTCFVFEEVGVTGGGGSSREWQSKVNKFFFSFLQTARHRNQVLMFTCPHFGFLEKGARSLVHMQLISLGINYQNKVSYWKPFTLQVNSMTGKIYMKYLRFKSQGGTSFLRCLNITLPPKDILDDYEKLKTKFTTDLYTQAKVVEKPKRVYGKVDTARVDNYIGMGLKPIDIAKLCACSEDSIRVRILKLKNSDLFNDKMADLPRKRPFSMPEMRSKVADT